MVTKEQLRDAAAELVKSLERADLQNEPRAFTAEELRWLVIVLKGIEADARVYARAYPSSDTTAINGGSRQD